METVISNDIRPDIDAAHCYYISILTWNPNHPYIKTTLLTCIFCHKAKFQLKRTAIGEVLLYILTSVNSRLRLPCWWFNGVWHAVDSPEDVLFEPCSTAVNRSTWNRTGHLRIIFKGPEAREEGRAISVTPEGKGGAVLLQALLKPPTWLSASMPRPLH